MSQFKLKASILVESDSEAIAGASIASTLDKSPHGKESIHLH